MSKVYGRLYPIVGTIAVITIIASIIAALTPKTSRKNSMEHYKEQESWAKTYWWAILGLSIIAFMIISGFVYVLFNKKDGNAEMLRLNGISQ